MSSASTVRNTATSALYTNMPPLEPYDWTYEFELDPELDTSINWDRIWENVDTSRGLGTVEVQEAMKTAARRHERAVREKFEGALSDLKDMFAYKLDEVHKTLHANTYALDLLVDRNGELARRVTELERQLAALPADTAAGTGGGPRLPKMADPPIFSGSDSKQPLEDWLNQISLYCSSMSIVMDKQRIVCALGRLRTPASRYMQRFFTLLQEDKDLGLWIDFVKELKDIYGQKDTKESAKEELDKLCGDKKLASTDFIKFAERFKTLARLVNYGDDMLIDKLKKVETQELRQATIGLRISGQIPTDWEKYIELLLQVYKELHPDKAKESIFKADSTGKSNDAKETSGGGKTKENNSANTSTAKFCQICSGKGKRTRAKTHNTNDCYDKPGNESKRPQQQSTSQASGSKPSGNNNNGNTARAGASTDQKKQFTAFKTRLAELQQEFAALDDDDSSCTTPAGTINVNTASIQEVPDTSGTEIKPDNSASSSTPKWRSKRRTQVDFPESL